MSQGLPARQVALMALAGVLRQHLALDEALRVESLEDGRDRAFARLLTLVTLRRLGQIDALLTQFLERPLPPKSLAARDILRLAAAQLMFLDTPVHAAVDSAVHLAKAAKVSKPFIGLINALLRRLAESGKDLLDAQDAARLNTPDWLWESWCGGYGEAVARAIATAHLQEAPLDLSVKDDAIGWAARLGGTVLPTGTVRLHDGGFVADLPGYEGGSWWVQDAAAALPARLLGAIAGKQVADLCAAPGGKTAQLAAMGAKVTAVDRSGPRLERLSTNLARLMLDVEVVVADAAAWTPGRHFDAVLLDAPCSATGTLRRHPDAAWIKRPDDIAKLAAAQDRLLDAAVDLLAPGGILVYCTCSLERSEGDMRIEALLARDARVGRVPIVASEVGDLADLISPAGDLRCLPFHLSDLGGMDGFYAARLQKR